METTETTVSSVSYLQLQESDLLYLMTFADNLSSFHCGINAVGHVEQEHPWSSWHTPHIYTSLQLQTRTHTETEFFIFHCGEAEGSCVKVQCTKHDIQVSQANEWEIFPSECACTFSPGFRSPRGTSGSRAGAVSSQTFEPSSVTCVVWPRLASWPGQTRSRQTQNYIIYTDVMLYISNWKLLYLL